MEEKGWGFTGTVGSADSSFKNRRINTDGKGRREKEAEVTVKEK